MAHSPEDEVPPNWLKAKVFSWFLSLTPTCREVARLTSQHRDHPLPMGTRWRLGLHRSFCQWCARYARQLDLLHEASQLFPEHLDESGGPVLEDDAKARMKRKLSEESERQ